MSVNEDSSTDEREEEENISVVEEESSKDRDNCANDEINRSKLSEEDMFDFDNSEWTDKEMNDMSINSEAAAHNIDQSDAADIEENQNDSSFKKPSNPKFLSTKRNEPSADRKEKN